VPWDPERFSAGALERIWDDDRRRRALVPFFAGMLTGETRALVGSFAGEPELHHPVRGRVKGAEAFERWVEDTKAWMASRGAVVEDVGLTLTPDRGVEEVLLRAEGFELPVAVASDHPGGGPITEQRMYFGGRIAAGGDGAAGVRAPLLQPASDVEVPDAVGEQVRRFYGGDVVLEFCAVDDDGRACAVEYNAVARGRPRAGLAVCVRGDGTVRIYDDAG
jgi:hypothetical protein